MNLQNGYKVIYEKIADGERTFFASKLDGTKATQIGDAIEIGKYKLVYEKDGQIYGSETGVPTKGDDCFDAFNAVFKAAAETATVTEDDDEPVQPELPDNSNEEPETTEGEDGEESGDETDPESEE